MSFSQDIKNQISMVSNNCDFCDIAELSAMLRLCTAYQSGVLVISMENEDVKNRFCILYEKVFSKNARFENKNGIFRFYPDLDFFMSDISVRLKLFGNNKKELVTEECCKAAYIRGSFLGGGSVSDPASRYHLEFDTKYEGYAAELCEILSEVGIKSKILSRKGRFIVYIKDYESIADVLGIMGAVGGAMDLYNALIKKDIRNTINRRNNCEYANMEKVAKSAAYQLSAIKKIRNNKIFSELPQTLKEMAILRLENPECSLKELGEMLTPPIGKSGVNHRLKRLMNIAENL